MRSIYTPDRWVLVRIEPGDGSASFDAVLAGWAGGYLDSDEWRRSTPIVRRVDADTHWEFTGESGSTYRCRKTAYGCTGLMSSVLAAAERRAPGSVVVLPEPS